MKRKSIKILAAALACLCLAACISSDPLSDLLAKFEDPEPDYSNYSVPTPITRTASPDPIYHIEPLDDLTDVPLVSLHADWTDIPVYASTAKDGTVRFYTRAYEERSGKYGMLSVFFEDSTPNPIVVVDRDGGYQKHPDFAYVDSYEPTEYADVVSAAIDGIDETPRTYYIIRNSNGDQIGVVPVEIRTNGDTVAVTVSVTENAYMVITRSESLSAEPTEDPEEESESTASPKPTSSATPKSTPSATPSATPTPTPRRTPRRTPRPSRSPQPTATSSATPTPTDEPAPTDVPGPTDVPEPTEVPMPADTPATTPMITPMITINPSRRPDASAPGNAPTKVNAPRGYWKNVWAVAVPCI